MPAPVASELLWRGSLPPLGREAALKDGPAAQSNGAMRRSGKPPRHRVSAQATSNAHATARTALAAVAPAPGICPGPAS
ncbi:hypothetical protein B0D71_15155 [Pseudomonas laurylsulfativorans]|uniref:Uncharacterized protein n=1 Tax=Pseudomonas laurylsulfativorans TaxID=1943631 RepID=A0A2S3VNK9_9PSED|nr:hypothetical protein B0D71_15155 [Pseudomonas laurylsulfativorans]